MEYIKRTYPYLIMLLIPIIVTGIIIYVTTTRRTYEVMGRELHLNGVYTLTVITSEGGYPKEINTYEVSKTTFHKYKRGDKLTKTQVTEIQKGV